ncbi:MULTISPECIES: hypothetical protein [unclassified Bradyrhizobium]|uniref:hypothetical protein n=1 Tax=unclassified Bradyrhizobium TaxID=2631580 RepID=UPI0028E24A8A|nr:MULTISPECIES: hypothetical protein [unclassified Bradyrhizobium]
MSAGLSRLLGRKPDAAASLAMRRSGGASIPLGAAVSGLAILALIMFGAVGWLIMSVEEEEMADLRLAQVTSASPSGRYEGDEDGTEPSHGLSSVVPSLGSNAHPDSSPVVGSGRNVMDAHASLSPTMLPVSSAALDPAALSGLRISSQSWRRGGLGSKALVTFTLRNANSFAVKDVEISCAFSRRDGSHVTDRRRIVPGQVGSRSRKTFAAVHVGFVNVNVSAAKCALVAATKI